MSDTDTAINPIPSIDNKSPIKFGYRNYRGEYSVRTAIILDWRFGSTVWHPAPGYLLKAFDVDKQEVREFALADCNFRYREEKQQVIQQDRQNAVDLIMDNKKQLYSDQDYLDEILRGEQDDNRIVQAMMKARTTVVE